MARFLAAIGEPEVIECTELEFECAGCLFKAAVKKEIKKGWGEVTEWILGKIEKKEENSDENQILLKKEDFKEGKALMIERSEYKEGKTTPKKHYTDVIHFESRQWKYSKCKGAG